MDNPGHKTNKQEIQTKIPKFLSYADAVKITAPNSSGEADSLYKLQQTLHELVKKAFSSGIGASQLESTTAHNQRETTPLQVHEINNNAEKCLQKIKEIQKELVEDIQRLQTLQLPVSQANFVAWKSYVEIYQTYDIPTSWPFSRALKKIEAQSRRLSDRKTSLSKKVEDIQVNSKMSKTEKQKYIQGITRELHNIDKRIESNSKYKKYIEDILKFESSWEETERSINELYMMKLKAREMMNTLQQIEQELPTQYSGTSQAANLDKHINLLKQEASKHESNCIEQRKKALSFSKNMEQAYYGWSDVFLSSQSYEYTPPGNYQFFKQDDGYSCGIVTAKMILADKNPLFRSNETVTEIENAFPAFHSDGYIRTKAIPDALKKLHHPISYRYVPYASHLTIDKILDMPRQNVNGTITLILLVYPSHDSKFGHIIIIDDVIEKTFEYKGRQYKDHGVGIRDPEYHPYWVCLNDLRDCIHYDACVPT